MGTNYCVCCNCSFDINLERFANVVVYGKLRFCQRGISEGNSEVGKNATAFD